MAHTKRPRKSPAAPASPASGSHRGTLALFATLALSLATAIAAAAWLIVTTETTTSLPPSMTADAHATTPTAPAPPAAAAAQPTAQQPSEPSAPATPSAPAAAPSTPSAPSAAGQRAFIDPVTGQLRQPEHDELAAIAAAAAAAAPPAGRLARTATASSAPEFFGPEGSVAAVVPEDLHTFTVATRGPDGRVVIEHAQGAANAEKLVKANSAKKSPQAPVSGAQQKEDRNDR